MPIRPSPAVRRACDILTVLSSTPNQALSVSELARRADVSRATADAVLLALGDGGLVVRDDQRRYLLGAGCIALGDAARTANTALRAAAVHAEALARAEGAVVAVSMRENDETRVASVFDFGPPLGVRPRAGDAIDLVPPFGASFVAWDDESGIQTWLDRTDPPLTATEQAHYHSALAAVRRQGYSVTVISDQQTLLAAAIERYARDPDDGESLEARDRASTRRRPQRVPGRRDRPGRARPGRPAVGTGVRLRRTGVGLDPPARPEPRRLGRRDRGHGPQGGGRRQPGDERRRRITTEGTMNDH